MGIKVQEVDELYTSKFSSLDLELIKKPQNFFYSKLLITRVKRVNVGISVKTVKNAVKLF